MRRVMRRDDRPLLKTADPEAKMRELMQQRHPVYALSDLTIEGREVPHETIVQEIIDALLAGPLAPRPGQGDLVPVEHRGAGH
jgi:shikimate kinase